MGCCLSTKKGSPPLNAAPTVSLSKAPDLRKFSENCVKNVVGETEIKKNVVVEEEKEVTKEVKEENSVKKEIFVIKHRKSHERERETETDGKKNEMGGNYVNNNVPVRTSSCSKEEVDAILIQCGRLSRSNSFGVRKAGSLGGKYSGSKRSYDFDHEDEENEQGEADFYRKNGGGGDDDDGEAVIERRQRDRTRTSGRSSSSPSTHGRRRRTPSRERDASQRSGSRDRSNGNDGRRVSRSPGRRSMETNNNSTSNASNANSSNASGCTNNRPAKMVSVPATVSSLAMDKSNNGTEPQATTAVKRISVRRNAGDTAAVGSRSASSPRARSPARTNARSPARTNARCANENNNNNNNSCSNQPQQQPSLSRNSSRKAEQSPYRRNPLSEIDPNSLAYPQATGSNKVNIIGNNNNSSSNRMQLQKPNAETNSRITAQGTTCKGSTNIGSMLEETKGQQQMATSLPENLKPQTLTRSRSGRRSRDLDLNPETLLNQTPSYTTLLLEDIQNFHQKNVPSFSLPACVTKACSILEAVADLNSTTSSNLSGVFSEDRRSPAPAVANLIGKKSAEAKDPFVESEVLVKDDLMEPSFHKYVTVRRGGTISGEDMDGQESSGSNSFVGSSQQHWGGYSNSSWEPNSADSTDRWTSRSNNNKTREEDEKSPPGFPRQACSELVEEARRGFSGQRTGIGRGRVAATTST